MKDIFQVEAPLSLTNDKTVLKYGNEKNISSLISIIIPVYSRFETFKKALISAINQKCTYYYSIIVVDNNRDNDVNNKNEFEGYIESLKKTNILYYKNERNIGAPNNFNRGPLLIDSEYFVMVHEDDELTQDCLEQLLSFREKNNIKRELVLSYWSYINKDSVITYSKPIYKRFINNTSFKMRLFDWFLASPTNGCGALIHRKSFIEIGGYNPDYSPSGDYALFSLYSYRFGCYRLNEVLYRYRIGDNDSISRFRECIERDECFRNFMSKRIRIPQFLLKIIIKANKSVTIEQAEKTWFKMIQTKCSFTDKFVMKVSKRINNLSHGFWTE